MLSATSPGDKRVEYKYDGLGRRTEMNVPGVGKTKYRYDPLGRVTEMTNARQETTRFSYDRMGHEKTPVPFEFSGATQQKVLEILQGSRGIRRTGIEELKGIRVRIFGPDGKQWFDGAFR